MFERFTGRARKALVLSQEEARSFGHAYIGTEHILLGLLCLEDGIAADVLKSLGVTLDAARGQLESIVGRGNDHDFAQAPFTPRSKKVFELALRESMQLGHNYIGTEHLLLGLVSETEGVASQMLSNLGVEADDVRRQVILRLGDGSPESGESEPRGAARDPLVFRGRVEALRTTASFDGQPHTLLVDLDYAYAVRDTEDVSRAITHDDLIAGVIEVLEARELGSIETGVLRVGEYVLETVPAVTEITVSIADRRMPEAHAASGLTLSRTFRR